MTTSAPTVSEAADLLLTNARLATMADGAGDG